MGHRGTDYFDQESMYNGKGHIIWWGGNRQNIVYWGRLLLFFLCLQFVNLQHLKMGNSEVVPRHRSASTKSKLDDYTPVRRLGEGRTLLKDSKQEALVLALQHTFSEETQLREYTARSKSSLAVCHQFYLNAFDYEIIEHSTICSRQYKLIEFFDYEPHSLKTQIESRAQSLQAFSPQQVMSILCSCVLVMSHFSRNEIVHYTLNPSDIIIDGEGVCKVVSSVISEYLFDHTERRDFYYAPETLKMFRQGNAVNGLTNKAAVFTLGVTLMNMITLQEMSQIYDYGSYTVNGELLQEEIRKIGDVDLRTILSKMLRMHSYERITFTELQEMLFEMITRTEKDRGRVGEVDGDQIAGLQQRIGKIKSQEHSKASQDTEHTHRSDIVKGQFNSACCLERDEESEAQSDRDHMLVTCQDGIVFDEFEPPMGRDLSESVLDKQLPLTMAHQRKYSGKELIENSNVSNGLVTYREFSSLHYQDSQKENMRPQAKCVEGKKSAVQEYPEYVSEKLEEGQYEGYKLGGYRHGFGSCYYAEGGKYCGEWVRDKMEGRGVLYYPSGKIAYEGQWRQDKLHGYGVLYNQNISVSDAEYDYGHLQYLEGEWIKYEGYFEDDVKKGQGSLFLSNGESYRGSFEKDQPHGMGLFRNVRGETVRGCWLMGALNMVS